MNRRFSSARKVCLALTLLGAISSAVCAEKEIVGSFPPLKIIPGARILMGPPIDCDPTCDDTNPVHVTVKEVIINGLPGCQVTLTGELKLHGFGNERDIVWLLDVPAISLVTHTFHERNGILIVSENNGSGASQVKSLKRGNGSDNDPTKFFMKHRNNRQKGEVVYLPIVLRTEMVGAQKQVSLCAATDPRITND